MSSYRTLAGSGKFTFEDRYSVSAPFTLDCQTNGSIDGWITPSNSVDASEIQKRIRNRCRLEGKVSPSCKIVCSRLLVHGAGIFGGQQKFKFASEETVRLIENRLPQTGVVQIKFGLANFIFLGNLHPRLSGSLFAFKLNGTYSELSQKLSDAGSKICAIVEVICPPQRVPMLREAILGVAPLLSLARGTFVAAAFMEIAVNGAHVQSEIWPFSVNSYRNLEPLLETDIVSNIGFFLQNGIVAYSSLRSRLDLDRALRYCLFAKTIRGPIELQFMTIFMALESLLLRLQTQGIVKTRKPSGKRTSLVLRRLRACLRYYKLTDRLGVSREKPSPNFATIRNSIVHTGDFPKGFDASRAWKCYLALIDLYQRLLLTILTYKGRYLDCTNGYRPRNLD